MLFDAIVIGGGASGLAAAVYLAQHGRSVLLLEKNDRVGRKLLATGNGRCNLANERSRAYLGDAAFAEQVLRACPPREVCAFFERLGVPLRADAAGRVYPGCSQASAVLDALRAALDGVQIAVGQAVTGIRPHGDVFEVYTALQRHTARRVALCCGGLAGAHLGAQGSHRLLTNLGLGCTKLRPALTPLITDTAPFRGLAGQRLNVLLTLTDRGEPLAQAEGEVLFTAYGLSGICAMETARSAGDALAAGGTPTVHIDCSPALGLGGALDPWDRQGRAALAREWLSQRPHAQQPLLGALPRLLRERLERDGGKDLSRALTDWQARVTGVQGWEQAQVTAGGMETRAFDPLTLECRRIPGLYCCGEMLNVDGPCGGYNLQFAFACGLLAARSICA